jgi:hypothetical protein
MITQRTFKIKLGQRAASEIYDSMEGAVYEAKHGQPNGTPGASGPFSEAVLGLSEKIMSESASPNGVELTESEMGRLVHEIESAAERVAEWNVQLAVSMSKKRTELQAIMKEAGL